MDVTKFPLSDCFSQIPLEFSRLDLVLQVPSQVVQNLWARKTRVCFLLYFAYLCHGVMGTMSINDIDLVFSSDRSYIYMPPHITSSHTSKSHWNILTHLKKNTTLQTRTGQFGHMTIIIFIISIKKMFISIISFDRNSLHYVVLLYTVYSVYLQGVQCSNSHLRFALRSLIISMISWGHLPF